MLSKGWKCNVKWDLWAPGTQRRWSYNGHYLAQTGSIPSLAGVQLRLPRRLLRCERHSHSWPSLCSKKSLCCLTGRKSLMDTISVFAVTVDSIHYQVVLLRISLTLVPWGAEAYSSHTLDSGMTIAIQRKTRVQLVLPNRMSASPSPTQDWLWAIPHEREAADCRLSYTLTAGYDHQNLRICVGDAIRNIPPLWVVRPKEYEGGNNTITIVLGYFRCISPGIPLCPLETDDAFNTL